MEFGESNAEQMTEAALTCHVGVAFISAGYADSKWCLRELNTFLKRRNEGTGVVIPVYNDPHLLEKDPLYGEALGSISSMKRHTDEPGTRVSWYDWCLIC